MLLTDARRLAEIRRTRTSRGDATREGAIPSDCAVDQSWRDHPLPVKTPQ